MIRAAWTRPTDGGSEDLQRPADSSLDPQVVSLVIKDAHMPRSQNATSLELSPKETYVVGIPPRIFL